MSATLSIVNNLEMESNGSIKKAKQGPITGAFDEAFDVTVDGNVHLVEGSLATASVVTLWDDDDDAPVGFDYLHLWADQDCYVQLIGPTMQVTFKVEAKVPFTLPGFGQINASASAAAIAGGTEPTMSDIDSIVLGNYSGAALNYSAKIID